MTVVSIVGELFLLGGNMAPEKVEAGRWVPGRVFESPQLPDRQGGSIGPRLSGRTDKKTWPSWTDKTWTDKRAKWPPDPAWGDPGWEEGSGVSDLKNPLTF